MTDRSPAGEWQVAPAAGRAAPAGPLARALRYAWENKAWWIVPMVLTLLTLSTLVFVASRQQVAPFFYAVNG
jgi:hypothetical protein